MKYPFRDYCFQEHWFSHSPSGPSRRHLNDIPFLYDIVRALMDAVLVLRLNISPEGLSKVVPTA